jgi:predicted RNase H-like HicB family nuclease
MQVNDSLELSAVVRKEGKLYVALCPEFDVASQGKSVEDAFGKFERSP